MTSLLSAEHCVKLIGEPWQPVFSSVPTAGHTHSASPAVGEVSWQTVGSAQAPVPVTMMQPSSSDGPQVIVPLLSSLQKSPEVPLQTFGLQTQPAPSWQVWFGPQAVGS